MAVPLVDYLVARDDWPAHSGQISDYVLAGNGVFLVAENDHLDVRVNVAPGDIRGLPILDERIALKAGKVPFRIWMTLLTEILAHTAHEHTELMMAVTHEAGRFVIHRPEQEASGSHVTILRPVFGAVLEIHSHCGYPARFSARDDADEQGLRLYAVVGCIEASNARPEVALRLGAYGYFVPLHWTDVFDGDPFPCIDTVTVCASRELEAPACTA